jgi:hypothetical protein
VGACERHTIRDSDVSLCHHYRVLVVFFLNIFPKWEIGFRRLALGHAAKFRIVNLNVNKSVFGGDDIRHLIMVS